MSPRIDYRKGRESDDSNLLPEGTYLAEVKDAKFYPAKEGKDSCFMLKWKVVEGLEMGAFLCSDRIMLGGNGFGPGIVKLRMLGFDVDSQDSGVIESNDLIGRRARLTVAKRVWKGRDGNPRTELSPVFDRDQNFGYAPVDGPAPAGPLDEEPVDPTSDEPPF